MTTVRKILTVAICFITIYLFSTAKVIAQSKTVSRSPTFKRYAIFNSNEDVSYVFKNAKATTLSDREILELENLLNACIKDYNQGRSEKIVGVHKYYKQFVPAINENGEKEVWINCFCKVSNTSWQQHIMVVMDGGNCYFQVKVNLSKKAFYELVVNGEA